MLSRIDEAFAFQEKAVGLRAYRQQILAANIANADTPNYKARDFDFATALKDAVAGRSSTDLKVSRTSSRHIDGTADAGAARLMYRTPAQGAADGNTVDMDIERGQFAENAIQYEAGLTFLTHQIKLLTAAMQS